MIVKPSQFPAKTNMTVSGTGSVVVAHRSAVIVLPVPTTEYHRPRREAWPVVGAPPEVSSGFDSTVAPVMFMFTEAGNGPVITCALEQLSLSGVLVATTTIEM